VASPALWSTFVAGTMPLDVGLTRFLIALPIAWGLISLVAELAFPTPGAAKVAAPDDGDRPAGRPADPESGSR
jgi:hypothetical protein